MSYIHSTIEVCTAYITFSVSLVCGSFRATFGKFKMYININTLPHSFSAGYTYTGLTGYTCMYTGFTGFTGYMYTGLTGYTCTYTGFTGFTGYTYTGLTGYTCMYTGFTGYIT